MSLETAEALFPAPDFWGRPTATVHAMDDVSLSLKRGETLSIVGESGCGKSTLGKTIVRLQDPTSGEFLLNGERADTLQGAALKAFRARVQIVFQDPFSSLNPRISVRETLAEPLVNFGLAASRADIDAKIASLLDMVGLPRDAANRYPHQFSGGQRQRIAIARALAPNPDIIVCDEAVSALDVSVKAQIVNLLGDIQKETGLALIFISHDLAIVEHLTHRVAVMYLGHVVEEGARREIFGTAAHPYTRALISAVPNPTVEEKKSRILLKGDVPSPLAPPSGCRFHTRCAFATDRCRAEVPRPRKIGGDHNVACHYDFNADGVLIQHAH
ncbi:peptide ABC transporter substrate-binding protein [Rhizobium yanglingense]|nr:peptide ABC transporter substrate-binding protein [Rhizobium yanglingense]